jgi:hypothetical protein
MNRDVARGCTGGAKDEEPPDVVIESRLRRGGDWGICRRKPGIDCHASQPG